MIISFQVSVVNQYVSVNDVNRKQRLIKIAGIYYRYEARDHQVLQNVQRYKITGFRGNIAIIEAKE